MISQFVAIITIISLLTFGMYADGVRREDVWFDDFITAFSTAIFLLR
jgi:hypothetical protein